MISKQNIHPCMIFRINNISFFTDFFCFLCCSLNLIFLGFIRKSVDNKFILAVDWSRVDQHAAAAAANTTRIQLDPDALNWSPLPPPGILFDSPLKSEASGGETDGDGESDQNGEQSEISALGNSKGLVGGASVTSKHRRKKISRTNKSSCHRDVQRESDGGSADGEQSDDSDLDSPTIGDAKYLKSSPKVSQNRTRNTYLKSPKHSDQLKSRRRSHKRDSSGEDSESSRDQSKSYHRGGRKAAKHASSAISRTVSKQQKRSDCDETSKSDSESERNHSKSHRRKESLKHASIRPREILEKSKFKRSILLETDESQDENKPPEKPIKSGKRKEDKVRSEVKKIPVPTPVISEDNSDHMPELEPQVQVIIPKSKDKPVSPPSEKSEKKLDKNKQKSSKEYFKKSKAEHKKNKMSANEPVKKEPKSGEKSVHEKGQRRAIENNFGFNQEYLMAFESFIQRDHKMEDSKSQKLRSPEKINDKPDKIMHKRDKESPEKNIKNLLSGLDTSKVETNSVKPESGKQFKLIASTLHPKKVLKAEKRKELERERLEKQRSKKESHFDAHLDTTGLKRKDREWEMNKEVERQRREDKEKERAEDGETVWGEDVEIGLSGLADDEGCVWSFRCA